jgi:hypothetical protein
MPITPFLNGDITFDPEGETRHGRRIRNGSRVPLGLKSGIISSAKWSPSESSNLPRPASVGRGIAAITPGAESALHFCRQLFANAVIAASRVAA